MDPPRIPGYTGRMSMTLAARLAALSEGLQEREEIVRVAFLVGLAGQNVLLLGPPGTAKSLVARRVAAGLGGRCFSYLLTRFTTPDEIFGPLSLRRLQDDDQWSRNTKGYLPDAEVGFLDEVFKASSAILNSLLGLLGDRVFHNGADPVPTPLLTVLAASNELPSDETLRAFADRFPVRLFVGPLQDDQAFAAMLSAPRPLDHPADLHDPDTHAELAALRARVAAVTLPPETLAVLVLLRKKSKVTLSDRRWRQLAEVLRASAAAHDRDEVSPVDLLLLRHGLWNEPAEAAAADALLADVLGDAVRVYGSALDPAPLHQRWRSLLLALRDQPNVGGPLPGGVVIEVGKSRFELGAAELHRWRHPDVSRDFERLRRTGVWWDGRRFVAVRRGPERQIYLRNGLEVHDAETFAAELPFNPPALADVSVAVYPRREPGVRLHLSEVRDPRFVVEAQALRAAVAARRVALLETERAEILHAKAHLFVPAHAVTPLLSGLARLRVELDGLDARAANLHDQLTAGGTISTVDVDWPAEDPP